MIAACYGCGHQPHEALKCPEVPPFTREKRCGCTEQVNPQRQHAGGGNAAPTSGSAPSLDYELVCTCSPDGFAYIHQHPLHHKYDHASAWCYTHDRKILSSFPQVHRAMGCEVGPENMCDFRDCDCEHFRSVISASEDYAGSYRE